MFVLQAFHTLFAKECCKAFKALCVNSFPFMQNSWIVSLSAEMCCLCQQAMRNGLQILPASCKASWQASSSQVNSGRSWPHAQHYRPLIKTFHVQFNCLLVPAGDEERVADSPYTVRVLAGKPMARKCTVAGAGRKHSTTGQAAEFFVEGRDQFGNR